MTSDEQLRFAKALLGAPLTAALEPDCADVYAQKYASRVTFDEHDEPQNVDAVVREALAQAPAKFRRDAAPAQSGASDPFFSDLRRMVQEKYARPEVANPNAELRRRVEGA